MLLSATIDRLLWSGRQPPPAHVQTTLLSTPVSDLRLRDSGGDRPAVVFLCDPPVMVEAYDALISELANDYRVIVVELPGFGFSKTHRASAYRLTESVAVVEDGLASLQLQQMVICGPCICGFVAAELTRRKRLPIKGLVLMQTPDIEGMLAWTQGMDPKRLLRTPVLGQIMVRLAAKKMIRFWLGFATSKAYDADLLTDQTLTAIEVGGAYPLASMFQLWQDGLSDEPVDMPALIIWGEQDRSHRQTDRMSTHQHAPDAELIRFNHCGHFSELEDPAGFSARLRPFLTTTFSQDPNHD